MDTKRHCGQSCFKFHLLLISAGHGHSRKCSESKGRAGSSMQREGRHIREQGLPQVPKNRSTSVHHPSPDASAWLYKLGAGSVSGFLLGLMPVFSRGKQGARLSHQVCWSLTVHKLGETDPLFPPKLLTSHWVRSKNARFSGSASQCVIEDLTDLRTFPASILLPSGS